MPALRLLWMKVETVGLPAADPRLSLPLSVGALITDKTFAPLTSAAWGYVGITPVHKKVLTASPKVAKKHMESGVLQGAMASTDSIKSIERDIVEMIDEGKGKVTLAGEGMANFLWPIVHQHFPRVAERLEYWPYDTSAARRFVTTMVPEVAKRIVDGPSDRAHDAIIGLGEDMPAPISFGLAQVLNTAGALADAMVRSDA